MYAFYSELAIFPYIIAVQKRLLAFLFYPSKLLISFKIIYLCKETRFMI